MMYDCITRPGKPTAKLIGVDGEHQPRFMVSVPCFVTEPINQAEIILEAPARKRRWGFVILSPSPVLVASAMGQRSCPLPSKGNALTDKPAQRNFLRYPHERAARVTSTSSPRYGRPEDESEARARALRAELGAGYPLGLSYGVSNGEHGDGDGEHAARPGATEYGCKKRPPVLDHC